ncbi:unnamed protein product, partial [Symbiodinium sp. KB8]
AGLLISDGGSLETVPESLPAHDATTAMDDEDDEILKELQEELFRDADAQDAPPTPHPANPPPESTPPPAAPSPVPPTPTTAADTRVQELEAQLAGVQQMLSMLLAQNGSTSAASLNPEAVQALLRRPATTDIGENTARTRACGAPGTIPAASSAKAVPPPRFGLPTKEGIATLFGKDSNPSTPAPPAAKAAPNASRSTTALDDPAAPRATSAAPTATALPDAAAVPKASPKAAPSTTVLDAAPSATVPDAAAMPKASPDAPPSATDPDANAMPKASPKAAPSATALQAKPAATPAYPGTVPAAPQASATAGPDASDPNPKAVPLAPAVQKAAPVEEVKTEETPEEAAAREERERLKRQ